MNKSANVIEPWKLRVIEERDDLEDKIMKLVKFMDTDKFDQLDGVDKELLRGQLTAMEEYANILQLRIDRFDV